MSKTKRAGSPGDATKAIGYLRVSKAEGQELGPEAQRAAINAWAARSGVKIVAWFEEHLCGASPIEDRTALLGAVDALIIHGAGVLVVAKRDRIARDVVLTAMIERLTERNGARVVSAAGEGTDSDDPSSILMRRMIDAFAEYERAIIRARTKAALGVKKSRGERVGKTMYGYSLAHDGIHLVPVETEQAIIRSARAMRASGATLAAIADMLYTNGALSRTGRRFAETQILRMLNNSAS